MKTALLQAVQRSRGRGKFTCRPKLLPKRTVLFWEGEAASGIYLLCKGQVKLTCSSNDGRAGIGHWADAGSILGMGALVSGTPHQLTAEAVTPVQVSFMAGSDFLSFLRSNPEVALAASSYLGVELEQARRQTALFLASANSRGRLARFLLQCTTEHTAHNLGGGQPITVARAEIGELLGVTPETVSRLLTYLQRKGVVKLAGRKIHILNRQGLERYAD